MTRKPDVKRCDVWDERRLRIATEAAGVALWSWNIDTDQITLDTSAFVLLGLPQTPGLSFSQLSACIYPADLDRVRADLADTAAPDGVCETEFRIQQGKTPRWIAARGRAEHDGSNGRILYGVFLDITFRKQLEEERDLAAKEMHHRVKNLFSLSSALASIAASNTQTKEELIEDLSKRFQAMAAAQALVRPYDPDASVSLRTLLDVLLRAYTLSPGASRNVSVSAPDIRVAERLITPFAMIIHELATNSAKHGALSSTQGRIVLSGEDDEEMVRLVWTEDGSPAPGGTQSDGFGSAMTQRVIRQFGGSLQRDWTEDGMKIVLSLDKALLVG